MICCCTNWYRYEHFKGVCCLHLQGNARQYHHQLRCQNRRIRKSNWNGLETVHTSIADPSLSSPGWYRVNNWCLSCGLFAYMTLYFTFSSEGSAPHLDVLAGTFHYHSYNAPRKWGGGVTQSALIKRWCKGAVEEGGEIKSVLNGMSQFYCSARVVGRGGVNWFRLTQRIQSSIIYMMENHRIAM